MNNEELLNYIAELVKQGYTSGRADTEETGRVAWELNITFIDNNNIDHE